MFIINDCYLKNSGLSFSMPKDFFIDYIAEDFISIKSLKKSCRIEIRAEEIIFKSPLDSINDIFSDINGYLPPESEMLSVNETGFIWDKPPVQTKINGILCAKCRYSSSDNKHLEIHFEKNQGESKQLELVITIPKEYNYEFFENEFINNIINSFQKINP